jgi:hypothetical protein
MEGGSCEDEIAYELGVHKNTLRRKHIVALRQGREARRQQTKAEREEQTKKEAEFRAAWFAGFGTKWELPDGRNPLQQNMTLAEAEAAFARLKRA